MGCVMTDNNPEQNSSTEEFAEAITRHLNAGSSYRNVWLTEVSAPAAELHRLIFGGDSDA